MIKRVKVYPTNRGLEWIKKKRQLGENYHIAVISINEPYEEKKKIEVLDPVESVLYLSFFDLNPMTLRDNEPFGVKKYTKKFVPKRDDLKNLKTFLDDIPETCDTLLVLSPSGVSRGPAIAAAACKYLGFPDNIRTYQTNTYVYGLAAKELDICFLEIF